MSDTSARIPTLAVGFHNRGHGRGDYAVLIGGTPCAVARIEAVTVTAGGIEPASVDPRRLASLFAAAPELQDACRAALDALLPSGNTELIAQLQSALQKSGA